MSYKNYEPWEPITDRKTLKVLGKALEETGELSKALSRTIIQGVYEYDPKTKQQNRAAIFEECFDVIATIGLVLTHLGMTDVEEVLGCCRSEHKTENLTRWIEDKLDD